jgi:hypothetical protein
VRSLTLTKSDRTYIERKAKEEAGPSPIRAARVWTQDDNAKAKAKATTKAKASNEGYNAGMLANLAIDDRLLERAHTLGGHRTKRAAVTAALEEYILRREEQEILTLFGRIEYAPDYDYKRERKAARV